MSDDNKEQQQQQQQRDYRCMSLKAHFPSWRLREFVLRFQRISDTRFIYRPPVDLTVDPTQVLPYQLLPWYPQESVIEVRDPYLVAAVSIFDPQQQQKQQQDSNQNTVPGPCCLGRLSEATNIASDLIDSVTLQSPQCINTRALIVAPPTTESDSSGGLGPMVVHFDVWIWPMQDGIHVNPIPASARRASLCLPHACKIFAMDLSGRVGSQRPTVRCAWLPMVCRLYNSWQKDPGLEHAVPFQVYQQESGGLIRQAAAEADLKIKLNRGNHRSNIRHRRQCWKKHRPMSFGQAYDDDDDDDGGVFAHDSYYSGRDDDGDDHDDPRFRRGLLTGWTISACEWMAGCVVTLAVPMYDCCCWTRYQCLPLLTMAAACQTPDQQQRQYNEARYQQYRQRRHRKRQQQNHDDDAEDLSSLLGDTTSSYQPLSGDDDGSSASVRKNPFEAESEEETDERDPSDLRSFGSRGSPSEQPLSEPLGSTNIL